jgi:malate dehydrogenase (oxaloacetate-decarboxylating)(NADP+)
MRLLVSMGACQENIFMLDRRGVIYAGREGVNAYKQEFANRTDKRSLSDAISGADVFIGLSGANLLSADMLLSMADRPVVFACSNPDPEIRPELALETRDDLIIATGRSDYPNQVNNVLGFPFIFRGALDVRASCINEEMKIAAVHALCDLAREEVPPAVLAACGLDSLSFGPEYIIPKPMDGRLLSRLATAVARAAVDSGVARLPYPENYGLSLGGTA